MTQPRKYRIRSLEIHASHLCNLSCDLCAHYCNFKYRDRFDDDGAFAWLRNWSRRLRPDYFSILGGEPMLNARLADYLKAAVTFFPDSKRQLISNGLLAHRVSPDLPRVLRETGTTLVVSVYALPDARMERMRSNLALMRSWEKDHGITLDLRDHSTPETREKWMRYYRGYGEDMLPFEDGDPRRSRNTVCGKQYCFIIHRGSLWPCANLAFLPLIHSRLKHREAWQPYLDFEPLAITATDDELDRFVNAPFHPACAMCPATQVLAEYSTGV